MSPYSKSVVPPVVEALLLSNDYPSPADERFIMQEMERSLKEVVAIEQEIQSLRSRIQASKAHAEKLKTTLRPVRKLPTELIHKILLYLKPKGPVDLYDWCEEPRPWYLGMICRRWRAVALDTPQLWSSFKIGVDTYELDILSETEMMKTYLERSGNHPLTFVASCSISHPAFDALFQQSSRWKDVELYTNTKTLSKIPTQNCQFPLLHRLSIDGDNFGDVTSSINIFKHAPQLTCLHLSADFFPQVAMPWSQITEFRQHRSEYMSDENALDLLSLMPNIQELSLWVRGDPPPPREPIVLPDLRKLTYRGDHTEIFHSLTLPALEEFYLTDWAYGQMPAIIISLFLRSACSLTKLELGTAYADDNELIAILQATPSLVSLTLWRAAGYDLGEELFKALKAPSKSSKDSPLLPNLHSFKLATYRKIPFTATLFDMLESRTQPENAKAAKPVARLQSVQLLTDNPREPSASTTRCLETLRRRGLDVNVVLNY
ncbi:hypothetical protein HGRIS_005929 [Hohenbuehelia grisea]|uniref:F-box domain-containing protein n=1 Tax=Hohenbuehelia grisea TaxID=104357 RepID=A0ABR3JZ73_9AGAR